jgi:hypothetical protein
MATIVDTHVLLQVIGAAFAAGIGITGVFGTVIYASTRFADLRRAGRTMGAAAFGVFAAVGFAVFAAAVALGILVMTHKA